MAKNLEVPDTVGDFMLEIVDVFVQIVKLLQPLSPEDRTRTLASVCQFLNMRPYTSTSNYPSRPQGGAAR